MQVSDLSAEVSYLSLAASVHRLQVGQLGRIDDARLDESVDAAGDPDVDVLAQMAGLQRAGLERGEHLRLAVRISFEQKESDNLAHRELRLAQEQGENDETS